MISLGAYLGAIKQKLTTDRVAYANVPLLERLIKAERGSLPTNKDACWYHICSLMTPEEFSPEDLLTWGDKSGDTMKLTTIKDPQERLRVLTRPLRP